MNKSKIFNNVMKYTLVAMLVLLPSAMWGADEITGKLYLVTCKNNYGGSEGDGVLINDLESLLLSHNMLTKTADGAKYDVSQKTLYLKLSIYAKNDNNPQKAGDFSVSRKGEHGYSQITAVNLITWPYYAYKTDEAYYYYSGKNDNFSSFDLQYKILQGTTQDLTNYQVVVEASNDDPTVESEKITGEPTPALKIVYTIQKPPFKHYKGHANADGDFEMIDESKGQMRQKTSIWEYTYVVDDNDNNWVSLQLPFQDYENTGHALEPLGYFRWYNYDTDNASANLTKEGGDASLLNSVKDEYGNDKGFLAYNVPTSVQANHTSVGVIYTRPADSNWKGETVACDVSRYVDGMDATGSYLEHESTLSIRFIYHIIPASQLADQIKDNLVSNSKELTWEDGKNVTVGLKDDMAAMTLRVNLSDPTMYYFHPMTNPKKHVYYPETEKDTRKITESDFSNEIVKPTKVLWRVYNKDKSKYAELGEGNVTNFPRFYDVTLKNLNGVNTWYNLDGTATTDKPQFTWGDYFSVVASAADSKGNSAPIANFNCRVFNYYPKRIVEMDNGDITRRVAYLDQTYKSVAVVSFDSDSPELTLSEPTSADDNQSQHPSDWTKRSYGFVYRDLMAQSAGGLTANIYYNPLHSALHGEYGIYKTANVKGYSCNENGYKWYLDTKEIHDLTYENSGKSQYGSFLYVDASDESRTIATASFSANLCTGQQMAFSAGVNSITSNASTEPQLLFKLYGIEKDAEGNEKSRTLLHSFSSGDFASNTNDLQRGDWYQVFGKVTLQKEASVERFSDFRIEIDNYSKGTLGADYCVDDIRIYVKPAKVEVYQDKPVCGDTETGNIKLKIRAIHETLNALLSHQDTKIHFRFVNEDGTPVTGTGLYDYNLDGQKVTCKESYASVDVYDSEDDCKKHQIDGICMIETDADGESYIILGNHNFPLKKGKKYYVSVCTENDPDAADATWGNPANVCSIYSDWFELIGQTPFISDTDGNAITEYRVACADNNASVVLKGSLTTVDPKTGEKVTLTDVPFFWYLDQKTTPLNETASNTISISVSTIGYGVKTVYMKPVGTATGDGEQAITIGDVTYLLCDAAIPMPLRIAKDGPRLNFGFNDVDYPFNDADYEASLRIGLPQIKALKKGYLQIPLHSASYKSGVEDKTLTLIDDSKTEVDKASTNVFVATTNDPLWNAEAATYLSQAIGTLKSTSIGEVGVNGTQSTLDLQFSDDVLENFHEGYWYELRFVFEQRNSSEGTTNCPGEAYLKLKIVPEFVTWKPTASNGMNANWNNDMNWHRSSGSELYNNEYTEYNSYADNTVSQEASNKVKIPTIDNYVPMKFTKVTIGNLKGLPFPDLGNVVYRSTNHIATKLTNGKGNEATKYIQYDIMAYWDEADANKGLTDGDLKCEKFYGNTCHQIYFKPQGELRDQCYLVYDKAWVEKELKPNTWYTMSSPLQYIYAGDMYVPSANGRQETEAFQDIQFKEDQYSRSKYPVYQRAWMKSGVEEITPNKNYPASHYPEEAAAEKDVHVNLGYWSHIYNKVDESYASDETFGGFAIKAGNSLLPKNQEKKALLRLPKEDKTYTYYDYQSTASGKPTNVGKGDGHGKLLVAFNNDEKHLAPMTQALGTDNTSGFYLVANPYTCSISLKKFFEVNAGLAQQAWIVEGSEVKAIAKNDFDKNDFAIQPTQSFFVKKAEESDASEVKFTSAMYVDRLITSGLEMLSEQQETNLTIETQNAQGYKSRARMAVRSDASDDYDENEDVDLFCDQNLKEVPQVYTVAGSEAVAVNAVSSLSWIPLGVMGEKEEMVEATIRGIAPLAEPLYLYDAADKSYTELADGKSVQMVAGEHGRYFITQTRGTTGIDRIEAEEPENLVKVYSPSAGMIVVSALGGETLGRVEVFTLDGKMVHQYQLPGKQRMILRVPTGVYVVKSQVASNHQPTSTKVVVK